MVRVQSPGPIFMENVGKFMDKHGLTFEEEVYYANQAEIDVCDLCGEWTPITNWHDGNNYLTFCGSKLYCRKCNL